MLLNKWEKGKGDRLWENKWRREKGDRKIIGTKINVCSIEKRRKYFKEKLSSLWDGLVNFSKHSILIALQSLVRVLKHKIRKITCIMNQTPEQHHYSRQDSPFWPKLCFIVAISAVFSHQIMRMWLVGFILCYQCSSYFDFSKIVQNLQKMWDIF